MASKDVDNSEGIGWIGFAAFMLMLSGFFNLIVGFVALFKETAIYSPSVDAVVTLDYNQWGWVHMLLGVLVLGAAASLMAGHMYGRIVAVTLAVISAVVNLAFIPVYPFWSIIIIVIDVMIIHAVVVHGGKLKLD